MNHSSFDEGRACFFAIRRCLSDMPACRNSCGYIRVSIALLLTVAAVLWIINHTVTKQGIEDPYTDKIERHLAQSPPQASTKSNAKITHQTSLRKMKGSSQKSARYKTSAADSIQEEGAGQEIIKDEVYGGIYDESSSPAAFIHLEDGGSNQSANNNHARSMADLVRSIENLEAVESNQMEQAIRDLWIVAADLGAPDKALDALEYFIMEHHNTDLIDLADSAIEDLQRVREIKESTPIHVDSSEANNDEDQTGTPGQISSANSYDDSEVPVSSEASAILQAQMEDLSDQALLDPDASKRGDAIQAVSNFRNDAAVDILMDAADDPEPLNRYLAVQALWISAADGPLEKKDFIWQALQQAQGDIDAQVADLANRALTDLDQLEQDPVKVEAETAFGPEYYSEDVSPAVQMHETDGRSDPSLND